MKDIWEKLAEEKRPILMYGMGLGGDKILGYCEKKSINIEGFFASDGFVRGHSFHGKRVMSYSEVCEKYGDFVVVLSFASSIPTVMGQFIKISTEHELYAPDVPVAGDELFDMEFYKKHEENFNLARQSFADQRSRELFNDMIMFKLTGELKYLFRDISTPDETFKEILSPESYETCVDLGAYNGDTVRDLRGRCPNLKKIISFEPDRKNFLKLEKYAIENCPELCETYNCAVGYEDGIKYFSAEASRNSALQEDHINGNGSRVTEVVCRSVDSVCNGRTIDFIKYDVEGAEHQGLLGAKNTIKAFAPDLLVSMYHRSRDLFDLPLLVKELNPEYRLFLRRFPYVPAWDLNLYAVDGK